MNAFFEWAVEETTKDETELHEAGEVMDVNHFDTYAEALAFARTAAEFDPFHDFNVVLVRDGAERSWAYLEDNAKLPEYFRDAYNRKTAPVPLKFFREVAA